STPPMPGSWQRPAKLLTDARAQARPFRAGLAHFPLPLDVLPDDRERCPTARGHEIARRPQHTLVVAACYVGPDLPEASAGYALEAVHEPPQRHGRRILDQQVDVIVLAVARLRIDAEIRADLGEDAGKRVQRCGVEHAPAVLSHEDQVCMEGIDHRAPAAEVACFWHRPTVSSCHASPQGARLPPLSDARAGDDAGPLAR